VSTLPQFSEKAKNILEWLGVMLITLLVVAVGFWSDTNTIGELIEEPQKETEPIVYQQPVKSLIYKANLEYIWEQRQETPEEIIIRLTSEAGTNTKIALAIAECESGFNPGARHRNRDGSIDRGLWQWNSSAHPEISNECAYDAECSTKEFIKYQQANHLTPWVCYSSGRYKKYLK